MNNFDIFCAAYEKNLAVCIEKHPGDYMPGSNAKVIAEKMNKAFRNGSFNKDGKAVKMTCKELGINHTYKDIAAFIK